MALSDICAVTITSDSVGVTAAGFGVPLILSHKASVPARVTYYTKALDMIDDGFATTDPEYLAVQAMLSADTKVEKVGIGRCSLKPTQVFKVSVATVTAGETYKFRIGSDDISSGTESGTFAANDEIINDLNTAFTAAAVSGYTAAVGGTVGSKYLTITSSTAGNWIAIENYDASHLLIEETTADPGIATDLAAIYNEDSTWYGLMTLTNSKPIIKAVAAWVESNEKLYIAATHDTVCATVALAADVALGAAGSVATNLKTSAYARTHCFYHPASDEFPDAALLGKCLPLDPGSETWLYKTLAGVAATTLTTTQRTNLKAKYCGYYVTEGGVNLTMGDAKVAANEYIDVVRFRDWLQARIQERIVARLAGQNKIPFTDKGVGIIKAEVLGQLDEGVAVGGLAEDPAPTCLAPKVADVSTANKRARHLPDVRFTGTLAGAIHTLAIDGVVSV